MSRYQRRPCRKCGGEKVGKCPNSWYCAKCGTESELAGNRYNPFNAGSVWQRKAISAVSYAVKTGVLPTLDGLIACVDCSDIAVEYDHRDYSRPLDVEPVCRACNARRGRAKLPEPANYRFATVWDAPAPKQDAA